MTKNVNFSSNTTVFYTYTLEEYPGRIPDPPLRLTFKDATELLELRSMFRKETKQLEAVRAKLEEEQEQNSSLSTDILSNSDLSDCATGRDTNCEDYVLSEMRKVDLDIVSVHGGQQPASALITPPTSPSHLHPSPPPSPASSALHSRPPPIRPSSNASRCEQIDLPLSHPLAHLCILSIGNNHSRRFERMLLSPCFLQDYQSIGQDSNASHPNDIRPYGARLVEV